jgi:hypothetical protein
MPPSQAELQALKQTLQLLAFQYGAQAASWFPGLSFEPQQRAASSIEDSMGHQSMEEEYKDPFVNSGGTFMSPQSLQGGSPASLLREPVLSASPLSFLLQDPPPDSNNAQICYASPYQQQSSTTNAMRNALKSHSQANTAPAPAPLSTSMYCPYHELFDQVQYNTLCAAPLNHVQAAKLGHPYQPAVLHLHLHQVVLPLPQWSLTPSELAYTKLAVYMVQLS